MTETNSQDKSLKQIQHPISNPFVIQTTSDTEVFYHASHFSISQCMGKYLEVNSHAEVCSHPTPAIKFLNTNVLKYGSWAKLFLVITKK